MKIVTNVLEDIHGIELFYIVGLFLFIIFFTVMFFRMRKMPNEKAQQIKESILEDNPKVETQQRQ